MSRRERANHKRRQRPDPGCCGEKPRPKTWSWGPFSFTYTPRSKPHKWNYSGNWNGNDKRVLPWLLGRSRGIPRAGWRCYNCGEMVWDESDLEYMARQANSGPGRIDVAQVITDAMMREEEYED